jgi:hypothetical protein
MTAGQVSHAGLADMHVHLEYIEDPNVLKLFVAQGVTTVRNMDGRPYILKWRGEVAADERSALASSRPVPIIDGSPPARPDNLAVADAAAARAAVASQAAAGYDFIKLYSNLSPDAHAAAVAEARERGLRAAGMCRARSASKRHSVQLVHRASGRLRLCRRSPTRASNARMGAPRALRAARSGAAGCACEAAR